MNHLLDNRDVWRFRLKYYQTLFTFTSGTTTNLSHHHVSMLKSTEIGIVQQIICIQYSHHRNLIEVKAL